MLALPKKLNKLDLDLVKQKKDPIKSMKGMGLSYASDNDISISRQKKGKGFIYTYENGKLITAKKIIKRINSLRIPPAWDNVLICNNEHGHIQATGIDNRKRKQYIYHTDWEKLRSMHKFNSMIPFAKVLPDIRKQMEKDIQSRGLTKKKIVALVIQLIDLTHIRVGNEEYAKENNSFGLTTFQNRHVEIEGDRVRFKFLGKSKVRHTYTIRNRQLAKIIRNCQEIEGQDLFQYYDENGDLQRITSSDINEYLQSITNLPITAKDFRTWAGTTLGAKELHKIGPPETKKDAKKNFTLMVKNVSKQLGNTTSVCKKYYIHPAIEMTYIDHSLHKVFNEIMEKNITDTHLTPYELGTFKIIDTYVKNTNVTAEQFTQNC
ncbi:MAG TPA: hypothetical protein VK338_04115 [Candidatus Nitrosocosmicus sp.]|nr:hypothetical protein [Candidatus Nitrosocosmicus sp.]